MLKIENISFSLRGNRTQTEARLQSYAWVPEPRLAEYIVKVFISLIQKKRRATTPKTISQKLDGNRTNVTQAYQPIAYQCNKLTKLKSIIKQQNYYKTKTINAIKFDKQSNKSCTLLRDWRSGDEGRSLPTVWGNKTQCRFN